MNAPCKPLVVVPAKPGSFQEMWDKLRGLEYLFVPYLRPEELDVSLSTEYASRAGLFIETPSLPDILDGLSWKSEGDKRVGLVATDPALVDPDLVSLRGPTQSVLERYFHSPRGLEMVVFNPHHRTTPAGHFSYAVTRVLLTRLLGMLQSAEPWKREASGHAASADTALGRDRIYEAYHHASLAREQQAPLAEVSLMMC